MQYLDNEPGHKGSVVGNTKQLYHGTYELLKHAKATLYALAYDLCY